MKEAISTKGLDQIKENLSQQSNQLQKFKQDQKHEMKKLLKEINPKSEKEIEASRKKDISEKFDKIMVQGCEKTITSIKQDQQVYLINVRNRI